MMNQVKTILNSEKAMAAVNLLFFLSMFLRNQGIIFIAYTAWIVCLIHFIKQTTSKAVKIVNGIFIAFAFSMIVANLYLMLKFAS